MQLKAQTKWGWMIAAYLFLAGLGAGAYVTGVIADFAGAEWASVSKIGVALGFPCVLLGTAFLIADLGTPANFWRAYRKPGTSWVARGTIIISVFMVVGFIHIGLWLWPFGVLEDAAGARQFIGVVGAIFAFGTMMYTGILLGANRPIAFWSTALVPVLFLVSALSTGIMAVMLIATIDGAAHSGPISTLVRIDVVLLVLEIVVVAMYLQATHRVPESRAAARLVLAGSVAPLFWLGVALLGLAVPLALELLGYYVLDGSSATTVIASISGIIGGLCLRQVVLSGGIQAPLRAGRFEFAIPNT
ncbi:MAG: polysulfide reductase NrfD [Actinobacteria bacterium]|nr:polysulfide reductase NrfD [Actinomycetota bacterium]